jgi:hypothetical protein
MGEIVIVSIETHHIPYSIWLGQIVGIMNRCYSIEPLYPTVTKTLIRVPFLFDPSLQKVPKSKVKKVLNSLKILYFS